MPYVLSDGVLRGVKKMLCIFPLLLSLFSGEWVILSSENLRVLSFSVYIYTSYKVTSRTQLLVLASSVKRTLSKSERQHL